VHAIVNNRHDDGDDDDDDDDDDDKYNSRNHGKRTTFKVIQIFNQKAMFCANYVYISLYACV